MTRETDKQKRSPRSFIRDLRRGLGSAIVELKNNPDREDYRAIVMRLCLRDIAYDTQVEGTKGFYLYTAVKTFADPEMFLSGIVGKFEEKLSWRLSEQICDLLFCFADDGSQGAEEALEKKYVELKNRLPSIHEDHYNEREQFERLMIKKLDGGFEAFGQCVGDMGEMILKRGDDDCLWYDAFLNRAEERFGKDIYAFLENAESDNVKAFFRMCEKSKAEENGGLNRKIVIANDFCKTYRPAPDEVREEKITIGQLVGRAKELLAEAIDHANEFSPKTGLNPPRIRLARMRQPARKFAIQASPDELETLARIAVDEPSDFIRTALLRAFSFADFPLDVGLLLPYATSDDWLLRDAVVQALSRVRDKRIHALAVRLFDEGQLEEALTLLEGNFEIGDEALIRKHVLRLKRVAFDVIGSVTDIYEKHRSNTCVDILLHLYKNAECSHCRYAVVETMINREVIPENILAECRYDSYEDTRLLADEAASGRSL